MVGCVLAALCQDAAVASPYSVLVGVGGISVDMADYRVHRVHTWQVSHFLYLLASLFALLTLIDTLTFHLDREEGSLKVAVGMHCVFALASELAVVVVGVSPFLWSSRQIHHVVVVDRNRSLR
jgi:hypothetical protein